MDQEVHPLPRQAASGRDGAGEVGAFLTHLAVDRDVAASTQNQARSALLFLYKDVLGRPIEEGPESGGMATSAWPCGIRLGQPDMSTRKHDIA